MADCGPVVLAHVDVFIFGQQVDRRQQLPVPLEVGDELFDPVEHLFGALRRLHMFPHHVEEGVARRLRTRGKFENLFVDLVVLVLVALRSVDVAALLHELRSAGQRKPSLQPVTERNTLIHEEFHKFGLTGFNLLIGAVIQIAESGNQPGFRQLRVFFGKFASHRVVHLGITPQQLHGRRLFCCSRTHGGGGKQNDPPGRFPHCTSFRFEVRKGPVYACPHPRLNLRMNRWPVETGGSNFIL